MREWHPGETDPGEDILFIADLNDIHDQRLEQVNRDTQDSPEMEILPGSPLIAGADDLSEPAIVVPLRYTNCGRIYHYPVHKLYHINDDMDSDIDIGDIIRCKGCASLETWL